MMAGLGQQPGLLNMIPGIKQLSQMRQLKGRGMQDLMGGLDPRCLVRRQGQMGGLGGMGMPAFPRAGGMGGMGVVCRGCPRPGLPGMPGMGGGGAGMRAPCRPRASPRSSTPRSCGCSAPWVAAPGP